MSWLSSLGNSLKKTVSNPASLLQTAGSFIPGVGPIISAVGGMIQGGKDQAQADKYIGQSNQVNQAQLQAYNQYYAPLMSAYAKSAGFNPETKTFDTGYNPYGGAYGDAKYGQYAEQTDTAYDQAANQISADGIARGFVGKDTATEAQLGALRSQEAADLAGFRRDLLVRGEDERYRRMAEMLPGLSSTGSNAQQNLMGLGANYASRAGNMGDSLGNLVSAVSQSGILDKFGKKKRQQSTSTGTTTANAAPMIA